MDWKAALQAISERKAVYRVGWPSDHFVFIYVPTDPIPKGSIAWFVRNGDYPLPQWRAMCLAPHAESKPYLVKADTLTEPNSRGWVLHGAAAYIPTVEDKKATDWLINEEAKLL